MSSKAIKQLTAKWYRKLANAGFDDIEDAKGRLKEWHSLRFNDRRIKQQYVEKQRYYELARQMLHTFPFTSRRNKLLWSYHCDGMGIEQIAKKLGVSESTVEKALRHLVGHIRQ